MRLIDADEFLKALVETVTLAKGMPVVDAIPIKWLKEQAKDTTYQHRVDGLIERWRREHE